MTDNSRLSDAKHEAPVRTLGGIWRVAQAIGVALTIISATRLVFVWLSIGPAPVVHNVFEFYSVAIHTILDPFVPVLQWLDWRMVDWFLSLPYWRELAAVYLLFGAVNLRSGWLEFASVVANTGVGRSPGQNVTVQAFAFGQPVGEAAKRLIALIMLPIVILAIIAWPMVLAGALVTLRDSGEYLKNFAYNTIVISGGVILAVLGNAGLTAG